MSDFFDMCKRYAGVMLSVMIIGYIIALMLLQLMASAAQSFPKIKKDDPRGDIPPVMRPTEPKLPTGCITIDGTKICPQAGALSNGNNHTIHSLDTPKNFDCIYRHAKGKDRYGEIRGKASPEAIKAVEWASYVLGVKRPFKVYSATFESSPIAYVRYNKLSAEIVYDADVFQMGDNAESLKWVFFSTIAHEIGHTEYAKPRGTDRWGNEASSDYISGMAVYRMNGDIEQALQMSQILGNGGGTHPYNALRRAAIGHGWMHGRTRHYDPDNLCKAAFIGKPFVRDGQSCKLAVTCLGDKMPVKTVCESDGKWTWQ